jgi:hypothetical protein
VHLDTPTLELRSHQISGAHFLEAKLGMGMDFSPQGGNGGSLAHDGIDEFHDGMNSWPHMQRRL